MELKLISSRKNVDTDKAPFFSSNRMMQGDGIPESGDYQVGDIVISNTQENDIFGWVCVEAGNPGTWNVIGGGGTKVMPYYNMVAFSDARTSIEIGIDGFNKDTDLLEVHYDGLLLVENIHYRISADGLSIEAVGDAWNQNADDNHEMAFRALRSNFEVQLPNSMIMRHKNTVTMDRNASEVRIGIAGFTQMKDILTVYKNSVYLIEGVDYDINADGTKIICRDGIWTADNGPNIFVFESLKNVQIMPENALVTMDNLDDDVKAAIATGGGGGAGDLSNYVTVDEMDIALAGIGDSIQTILTDHVWPMESNLQTKSDLTLRTTDKTLVGAINELFQNANDGKELIATAIGEPLSAEDTFQAMSDNINDLLASFKAKMMENGVTIDSGDKFKQLIDKLAEASSGGAEDEVLLNSLKSVLQEEGISINATDGMAELIAKVDAGFNDKNTEIATKNDKVSELEQQMNGMVTPAGNAVASNVLSGKTFINSTGQTITGTMTNQGSKTITPSSSSQSLGAGYYSGISISGDTDLKASNIKSGINIFGVTGTYTGASSITFNTKSLSNNWYPSYGYTTKTFSSLGFGYTPAMIIVKGYVEYYDTYDDIETWSYFALVGVGGNGVMSSYQDFLFDGDPAYMFDLEITSYNSSAIYIQASSGQFDCVDYGYGEVKVRFDEVWYTPN